MENLIVFILATAGLSWIVCRSNLFKSIRESVSHTYGLVEVERKFKKKKILIRGGFYYFLDSILGCVGCFAFWASQLNYIMIFKEISVDSIYCGFIGSITSLIIVNYSTYLGKK